MPGTGGTFSLPPESTIDEAAATTVLAGSEFVVDVQTHLLDYEPGTGDGWGLGFPQASCGDDPAVCMGIDAWLDLVLGGSDTAVAVLSAIPVVADPDPLSTEVMERARRQVEQLGCVGHVLIQGHATPTIGELPAALDAMAATAAEYEIAAWKAYTHEGPSWRLDDDIGNAFCDQVRALGQRIICVHKGLGPAAASPVDVGPAAANHPDLTFCIYHSGLRGGRHRGRVPRRRGGSRRRWRRPADRLGARRRDRPGRQRLRRARLDVVEPDPATRRGGPRARQAARRRSGPTTSCGGPTRSGTARRRARSRRSARSRSRPEYQERFGYPALTADVKARILGLNAARVYGIDPATTACALSAADRSGLRAAAPDRIPTGPTTAAGARATFAAEHPWFA